MRDFQTPLNSSFLKAYQTGVLSYKYKNIPCLKSPLDMAIYMRLLWLEKPKTIIEIGAKHGGRALLFSDLSKIMELGCRIVSIDINPPLFLDIESVSFVHGDILKIEEVFDKNQLYALPRPWFVVEDSAHTYSACLNALNFFSTVLQKREMMAIEDGILAELGLTEQYEGGPNRAIGDFLTQTPNCFDIETIYCDMFGVNATYNPNGYLRKK